MLFNISAETSLINLKNTKKTQFWPRVFSLNRFYIPVFRVHRVILSAGLCNGLALFLSTETCNNDM